MSKSQPVPLWKLGATALPNGECRFLVWAPSCQSVDIHFVSSPDRLIRMEPDGRGYFQALVPQVSPGTTYFYRLNGSQDRPDPASRYQPQGVHGPSEVVGIHDFSWTDGGWHGLPLEECVFYELHVGTFTQEGTFSAVINELDRIADLGISMIELMPIAQFPGGRNWGYDGVYPCATQNTYGTPRDLQQLVDAAHSRKLGVALDVVYNHLGPEGNYLGDFGPYFTDHYRTPWGAALNFDGPQSDEVRRFFIESALSWVEDFHIDALRLDAVHSIYDASALPFLAELSDRVSWVAKQLNRPISLIAESDLNDARVVRSTALGGYGLSSQWSDDFHHSLHALLTGETSGYYADFGQLERLATCWTQGWTYAGEYSRYRQRRHGNKPADSRRVHFVVCSQNHDQVGNRGLGERLSNLIDLEGQKLAAGATLLSSFLPLLFMGEEYGETCPFQYFTSHGDPQLAEAVRNGRRAEFQAFGWAGAIPDPQAESTFAASKLKHERRMADPHRTLAEFYKTLLHFRRSRRLVESTLLSVTANVESSTIQVMQRVATSWLLMLFNFGSAATVVAFDFPPGLWQKRIDSADTQWLGPGTLSEESAEGPGMRDVRLQPHSFVVVESNNNLLE